MTFENLDQNNFLLDEKFYFYPLVPFIKDGIKNEWKIEHIKIAAEEVLFNNTKDNAELIIVLSGSGGISIDGDCSLIKTGDLVHFPKNTVRSIANADLEELLHVILITIC